MSYRDIGLSMTTIRARGIASGTADMTVIASKTGITGTVTTGTSPTVFIDTGLGSTNNYMGRWFRFTGGTLSGQRRQASNYIVATQTVTVTDPFSGTPSHALSDPYEIEPIIPARANKMHIFGYAAQVATSGTTQAVSVTFINSVTGERAGFSIPASTGPVTLPHPINLICSRGDYTILFDSVGSYAGDTDYFIYVAFS